MAYKKLYWCPAGCGKSVRYMPESYVEDKIPYQCFRCGKGFTRKKLLKEQ